jgi:hypothetical protein
MAHDYDDGSNCMSWAAKVTGKKDISLKHPDQLCPTCDGEDKNCPNVKHPDSPNYSIIQTSGFYDVSTGKMVKAFHEGNRPDYYISPEPLSQMHQSMRNTFDECFDISLKKANDYSKGANTYRNFEGSERIGISVQKGILLRMQDKFVRLENLLESDSPKVAESIEDTLMDLINYTAILKARREYEATL